MAMRELFPKPEIAAELMAKHALPTKFPFYAAHQQRLSLKYILLAQLRALFSANLPVWQGVRFWTARLIETANKRKSRSEFRCGFLFEEPGGFGGEPGFVVVVVRPVRQNPSLYQEPSRVGRRRPGHATAESAGLNPNGNEGHGPQQHRLHRYARVAETDTYQTASRRRWDNGETRSLKGPLKVGGVAVEWPPQTRCSRKYSNHQKQ